jgi:hypothetical protein
MDMLPLTDIQLDRGSATNQIPVWNDTSKRFVPTLNPTGPADGIFGHWDRDSASATLAPAVAADTLRIDGLGPEDGSDDTLLQLATNLLTVNGNASVDEDAFLAFTAGSQVGLGTNAPSSSYKVHVKRNSSGEPTRALLVENISTTSTSIASAMTFKATSTGNMANGHGPGFLWAIQDNAGVERFIGRTAFYRNGADNSGKYELAVYQTGTRNIVMTADGSKVVDFFGDVNVTGVVKSESGRIKNTTRYTATQAIPVTDDQIYCNGTFTVTLPTGIDGQTFRIINSGTGTITITSAENIVGSTEDVVLNAGDVIILTFETTDKWW